MISIPISMVIIIIIIIIILQGIGHSWPVPVFRILTSELMNLFGHLVGLLGRGISLTQGLYLHT
jgi:ABC-type phosphate transport system auxiliary subunit